MYEISKRLSLPEGAELWTYGDLAIKGAGKTYAACVMAEEFVKAGVPIIAIDALGIWWGLRVGINGHEGLPVVVFGGEHKDISIPTKQEKGLLKVDEDKLKLMVRAILEGRMSAVIDVSELSKGMRRRTVAIFVAELYRLNQKYGPRHIFLEEADEWIPQRLHGKDEWAAACFGAVDDLVRKGGNFLLGTTLITQRSAVLSKDVLTQVNCLIALRILHKIDKKAVMTWVENVADPNDKQTVKFVDSLKNLKNGEAWIWHPEEPKLFDRVQFRERETLHATREYFTRSQFEQKDIVMMPVESFVAKFKKVFEPPTPKPLPMKQISLAESAAPIVRQMEKVIPQISPIRVIPANPSKIDITSQPMQKTSSGDGVTVLETPSDTQTVRQFLPTIEIRQFKPIVSMSVESMDEPTSPLGRVCVVLKNDAINGGRQDKWTLKRIIEHVERHSWPSDGVGEAVGQLQRWEILVRGSDNYYRFFQARVLIKEASEMIQP